MLVRNVRIRGKHKLADKWESIVHVVVSQKDNLPVYTVKPEHHNGPTRTLHRHLLLPCGFLPTVPENPPTVQEKPRRPSTRQHPITDLDEPELEYNSEEEDNYPLYYPPSPPREISRSFEEYEVVLPPKTHSNPAFEQPKSDNAQVSEHVTVPDNAPEGMNIIEMANSLETENVPEPAKEGEPKTQLNEMDNAPDSNKTNNEETSQTQIEQGPTCEQ